MLDNDNNTITELSVQQLVDCVKNKNFCGGSGGCNGSTYDVALKYIQLNGFTTNTSYPYTGLTENCTFMDDEIVLVSGY